ncbi:MAG: inositol monophosphatase [Corynebacterium sp.]|nr:inositol monophosphatase [Corynebacterium sp.]
MTSPLELQAIAQAAVDDVEQMFIDGLGAPPALFKGEGSFATEVDLGIEKQLRTVLTQLTGIPVLGEEAGGGDNSTMWVVDPIDGTANYAAGNPLCGIVVALVYESKPVVAVASFPLLHRRLVACEGEKLSSWGGPVSGFGGGPQALNYADSRGHIGCSTLIPAELLDDLRGLGLRPRMTGSVALDSAFVAQGVFDGAINFSPYPWDNAAGALFVRAAGGVATDPEGQPWTMASKGLVVGTAQVHGAIMDSLTRVRKN